MAWNHPTQKIESESKTAKRPRVWWGLGAGLIVAVAAVAGVVLFTAGTSAPPEKTVADEEAVEETSDRQRGVRNGLAQERLHLQGDRQVGCRV